ncbi:uncharacterized protein ATC70_007379 [Mucor velutinosus]|uniref:Uncharacterized protein n=1 Tax=Mucor velutinosus TaxID=708070 RepID=A0AAN7HPT5_9FUNG|nr:hypothetical protein ATC70_007379 [Mucor velutinosus]
MRSAIAISAAIATFATSAFAANCNPSYNTPGSTECFTKCNVNAGQKWVPGWTMDHTSELFLDSLALMCNKSGPNYGSFMATAGMCMARCTGDDPELFNAEFAGACAWWNTHKNDKCSAATTTVKTTSSSTTTKTSSSTTKASTTGASSTSAATTSAATTSAATTSAATTSAATTSAATTSAATTSAVPTGGATVTVTITKTVSACPTDAVCQSGFKDKKNGKGPEGACCSSQADCQESCISGKCNAPIASSCYTGSNGKALGDGYNGACCEHSDDCWESCVSGKCNGPSLASCNQGFSGKKGGKGPKNACCSSNRDCKNSCVKGKCN